VAGDDFERATPTFEAVAMDMNDSDAVASTQARPKESTTTDALSSDTCHPHLFQRTRDVVRVTNGGIGMLLGPLHDTMRLGLPRHRDGKSHSWERVRDGYDWKYSMEKTGDHSFTATLQVKKVGDADFVTVYTAQVERNPADHDGSGSATLDLTALHSVISSAATGKLSMTFALTPDSKKVIFNMVDYTVGSAEPRNGKTVFFKEHGKGGSIKFTQNMPLVCTGPGGSATGTTPVEMVARFVDTSSGIHYRADALATGGQIAAGDKWEGVTCAQGGRRDEGSETYWMMKLEDAAGATVSGTARESGSTTASACDAVFGAVPKVDAKDSDFDFASINFTSDDPAPFPGM